RISRVLPSIMGEYAVLHPTWWVRSIGPPLYPPRRSPLMFRSRHSCFCILCAVIGLALAWMLFVAPPAAQAQGAAQDVSFIKDVAPILKDNCFACHDSKKKKGKFDMSTYERFRQGGSKEDPVAPGKPKESVIIELLSKSASAAGRMPPKEVG